MGVLVNKHPEMFYTHIQSHTQMYMISMAVYKAVDFLHNQNLLGIKLFLYIRSMLYGP